MSTQLPEYILRQMIPFHCKRGSRNCDNCRDLAEEGEKYCVLRLFWDSEMVARPVTEVEAEGIKYTVCFEFAGCFATKTEAQDSLRQLTR